MKVRKFNENKNDPFDGEIFDEETELKNGKFNGSNILEQETYEVKRYQKITYFYK